MDSRSSYVLSTHELGRAPGAMRRVQRDAPALPDLATPVMAVVPDSTLALDLRLESVMDGVLVSGEVTAATRAECVRCLREIDDPLTVAVSELYLYPGAREDALAEGDEEAEDLPEVEGELLDLEPMLRDALITAMPLNPLCEPDCPGLCAGCGERWTDLPADHEHVDIDPRWAALGALLGDEDDDVGEPGPTGAGSPAASANDE